mgnify:CR=1 FL=1
MSSRDLAGRSVIVAGAGLAGDDGPILFTPFGHDLDGQHIRGGIALVRPTDFTQPKPGEDSDLVFGVEEAGFANGRWIARGLLSGAISLRIDLPSDANVHKGRLLALSYDPKRFRLLPRETGRIERQLRRTLQRAADRIAGITSRPPCRMFRPHAGWRSGTRQAAVVTSQRLLLDGVFNHVGRDFPRFREVLEQGPGAPAASWFDIDWAAPIPEAAPVTSTTRDVTTGSRGARKGRRRGRR